MFKLFSRSNRKGRNKKQVRKWADKQVANGRPRMEVYNEVMSSYQFKDGADIIRAHTEVGDELFNVMFERNRDGIEAEAAGDIKKAVALYEANVTDRFVGLHPYNRLRIIYTRQKEYEKAIRVCHIYIQLQGNNKAASKKVVTMQGHLDKLLEKAKRQ